METRSKETTEKLKLNRSRKKNANRNFKIPNAKKESSNETKKEKKIPKRKDVPFSAEREDTLEQKSIQEVDSDSGLKAEESVITNTSTNIIPIKNIKKKANQIPSRIKTMFGRTGKL